MTILPIFEPFFKERWRARSQTTATTDCGGNRADISLRIPPRPLLSTALTTTPFPIEALPTGMRAIIEAVARRCRVSIPIAAHAVFGAGVLAVQGHADVVLPHGQVVPISLFLVTIAASGDRKSAADGQALVGTRNYRRQLLKEHKACLAAWRRAKREAEANGEEPPPPPLKPKFMVSEPTIEGLMKVLREAQPSIALLTEEGGAFLGGHAMASENRLRTAAILASLWGGTPVERVRGGDDLIDLDGRRFSMHIMVQPLVARTLLSDEVINDQGLIPRLLVTAPETLRGTRFWEEPLPGDQSTVADWGDRILSIMSLPLPSEGPPGNVLQPRALPLSNDARKRWIAFHDHVEARLAPGAALDPIAGFGSKMPEHAARLAAVLTLLEDMGAVEVPTHCLEAGIALAEFYAAELLLLRGASAGAPKELRQAQELLDWLHQPLRGEITSVADICQFGPKALRKVAIVRHLVQILLQHGWLEAIANDTVVNGKRRREAFRIVPPTAGEAGTDS